MRLYLIRHGQSENNFAEHTENPRVADPALTPIGHLQAERLAQYLLSHCDPYPVYDPSNTNYDGQFGITHLFVSPMRRALQTILPLATAMKQAPVVWEDTHEIGGIWLERAPDVFEGLSGMTRSEMMADFPGFVLPTSISENGWWNRDRETREQCSLRTAGVAKRLQQMAKDEPQATVALVAHQFFIAVLLRELFGMQMSETWIQHYNTGITRIDYVESGAQLVRYINRCDHLDSNCVTT